MTRPYTDEASSYSAARARLAQLGVHKVELLGFTPCIYAPLFRDAAQRDLALGAAALARLGVAIRDRVTVFLPCGVARLHRLYWGRRLG